MIKILLINIFFLLFLSFAYSQSGTVSDIDGNVYKTVRIGNQVWMAENMRTSRYRGGSQIGQVTDNTTWSSMNSGAWCWYSNDPNHESTYGKLYNWYAISSGNLCPTGWHIPSESENNQKSEWNSLIRQLGGVNKAGGKMKERGRNQWLNPNLGATNRSGFTGRPGGSRRADGTYDGIRFEGLWWNASDRDLLEFSWSRSRILFYDSERIDYFDGDKRMGLSVRCVMN